jgi:hypothetical protein
VNVRDISLDKLTSGSDVAGRKFVLIDDVFEVLSQTLFDRVGEKLDKGFV